MAKTNSEAARANTLTSTMDFNEPSDNLKNYSPAVRDSDTGKIYSGGEFHPDVIANIKDEAIKNKIIDKYIEGAGKGDKSKGYYTSGGFIDKNGNFLNREEFAHKFGVMEVSNLKKIINQSKDK